MMQYVAIFNMRVKALFQYRAATFAGCCTQLFWGIIMVMIYTAFYSETDAIEPMTLSQAITFTWLGQALINLIPWTVDRELEAHLKNGNIIYELTRPIQLFGLLFTRALALRLIPTLMRCIPIFFLSFYFLGLAPPASFESGCLFFCALVFALLLSSAITTCIMISLFWTLSGEGIQRLMPHFTTLLSGLAIPLPLFPSWIQPFLNAQPIRGVMDIPCRLYTGLIPAADALYYFSFQLLWFFAFLLLGLWLIKRVMKNIVIQGG